MDADAAAPVPYWTIPPERFIGLHPRLTDLTPGMIQILGQGTKVTTSGIMETTNDEIKSRWIWRGISPVLVGNRPKDPFEQPWTELEQPGTLNRTTSQIRRRLDWHAVYTQSLAHYML